VRRAGAAGAGLPASTYARMGTKGARHCRFRRRAFISDKTSGAKTTLAELARLIARHPEITNAAKKNSLLVWPYNLAKRLPLQDRLLQFRGEYSRGSRRSEAEKPGTFLPGAGLWKLYKVLPGTASKKKNANWAIAPRSTSRGGWNSQPRG
jgi:hypothetical protein